MGSKKKQAVAGVGMPRTQFARDAAEVARVSLPAVLVQHAHRAFVFATLESKRLDIPITANLLYVSAQFSHMGLRADYACSAQRYELDGADAAKLFLERAGVRRAQAAAVWEAISLHTTPGLTHRMRGLTRLLAHGIRADLFGEGVDALPQAHRMAILKAFPRGADFARRYLEVVGRGIAQRPDTTFGTASADILERYDPTFFRANHCGRMLGTRWDAE